MLMATDFHCGFKIAVYARTVYIRRVVEREGVIKCLTVRCCARPLGAVAGRQASTQPPLATSATSNRAAVGSGIGSVRKPRPAWAVCGGCRLKAAFPDRVRRPRSAWLPAEGRQALGPAWPQPAAPPMHRPAGKPLDQSWRGGTSIWAARVGWGERLNGWMGRPKA